MIFKNRESLSLGKAAVKSIKRFKNESLFLDDLDEQEIIWMPLSIPSVSLIISGKYFGPDSGFALGKVYNFWGDESMGKTALAAQIASEIQSAGGHILWVDAESSFDKKAMKNMYGLDAYDEESVIVSVPDSIEDATDVINEFVKANSVDLIVIDSLVGLGTELIQNADGNSNNIGAFARRTSAHMTRLTKMLNKTKTSIIYINQIRSASNGMGGFKRDTTGGNAMKFYPHVSIRFSKAGYVDSKEPGLKYDGHYARLYSIKNKLALPFREVELRFIPGKGFSRVHDILSLASKSGLVKASGAWITIYDSQGEVVEKIQGVDKTVSYLMENPDVVDELWNNFKIIVGGDSEEQVSEDS